MAERDWYETEEPTRLGMFAELQRIRLRVRARPIRVIVLAALVTAAVTYKFTHKPRLVEARVVLALSEGSMSPRTKHIPFDTLQGYVRDYLLPDPKLTELIERRNLYPLRRAFGNEYAITELREQMEIEVWRNSFVYFDDEDEKALKSARIGITVIDTDHVKAFALANDLANIAIKTFRQAQLAASDEVSNQVKRAQQTMARRLEELANKRSQLEAELGTARRELRGGPAAALMLEVAALAAEEKKLNAEYASLVTSPEADADLASAAGLDTQLAIVEQRDPGSNEPSNLALLMIVVVIGTGSLLGSALLVGAFDSRVYEIRDVERIGLPVLGHVPGFQGDDVGSLEARGAARARVPSLLRWLSRR